MKPKTVGRQQEGGDPLAQFETCVSGLFADTSVLCSRGAVPVQQLRVGDGIITRDAGMVPLRAVRPVQVEMPSVLVHPGAFAPGTPSDAVQLPATQPVLIRDALAKRITGQGQAVLPVAALVDAVNFVQQPEAQLVLFQLGFDAPHVIYAGGLELLMPVLPAIYDEAVA